MKQINTTQKKYINLTYIFDVFLDQDWLYGWGTDSVVKILEKAVEGKEGRIITLDDGSLMDIVSLPVLHAEILDIIGKTPEEQYRIFNELQGGGYCINDKWESETFFLSLLHLTEKEMKKRNLEIPEQSEKVLNNQSE